MITIHTVQRENRHLYSDCFEPYFRLRHDIYVKQRKWMALDRSDGLEKDQFDNDDAVYLLCLEGRRIVGGMRAVPTTKPTLMSEIFPYLNERGEISQPDVYELSRVFVDPKFRGECVSPKIESQLMAAIMEYGLTIGLSGFTIVLETWWLPRLFDLGWKTKPLGLPVEMDGMYVMAIYVECDEETWLTNCERRGISGPLLQWLGLEKLDRLEMPLLSLHLTEFERTR